MSNRPPQLTPSMPSDAAATALRDMEHHIAQNDTRPVLP
jgi:hypothetical protein